MNPVSFQPPSQQRQRGLWSWYKRQTRFAKVGLGCGIIVAILLLCTWSLAAYGSTLPPTPTSPSPQVVATKAQPTATSIPLATPTATLVPTAIPTPKPTAIKNAGPAVLGGTLDAFIAKFGSPNDHSSAGLPHFERCGNSNIDQVILLQDPAGGTSGRIISVSIQACTSTSWTMSLAEAMCSPFFPADARYKRSVQIPGTQSQFAAVDKIYFSATLAHEFTADNFTDANNNPVQPGLFDVFYLSGSNIDLSHIDSCDIQLGTQQTQE